jgi:hypothetical protein
MRRIFCALGLHSGPFSAHYGLLNEARPWCWSVTVVCMTCNHKMTQLSIDERDAEKKLEELRNL